MDNVFEIFQQFLQTGKQIFLDVIVRCSCLGFHTTINLSKFVCKKPTFIINWFAVSDEETRTRVATGRGILSRVQMHSWLDFTQVRTHPYHLNIYT